jgi:hypothetical protein
VDGTLRSGSEGEEVLRASVETGGSRLQRVKGTAGGSPLGPRLDLLVGRARAAGGRGPSVRSPRGVGLLPIAPGPAGDMNWSFGLLSPPSRLMFAALSVCEGGFGLELAETLGGALGLADGEVAAAIADLWDQSLIGTEGSVPGRARYCMLALIGDSSARRLDADGTRAMVARAGVSPRLTGTSGSACPTRSSRSWSYASESKSGDGPLRRSPCWGTATIRCAVSHWRWRPTWHWSKPSTNPAGGLRWAEELFLLGQRWGSASLVR